LHLITTHALAAENIEPIELKSSASGSSRRRNRASPPSNVT